MQETRGNLRGKDKISCKLFPLFCQPGQSYSRSAESIAVEPSVFGNIISKTNAGICPEEAAYTVKINGMSIDLFGMYRKRKTPKSFTGFGAYEFTGPGRTAFWWRCRDLNPGHCGYEPHALTS